MEGLRSGRIGDLCLVRLPLRLRVVCRFQNFCHGTSPGGGSLREGDRDLVGDRAGCAASSPSALAGSRRAPRSCRIKSTGARRSTPGPSTSLPRTGIPSIGYVHELWRCRPATSATISVPFGIKYGIKHMNSEQGCCRLHVAEQCDFGTRLAIPYSHASILFFALLKHSREESLTANCVKTKPHDCITE